jgi:hypothetical protein
MCVVLPYVLYATCTLIDCVIVGGCVWLSTPLYIAREAGLQVG